MGYVGVVSAACLLRDGHEVTGVDPVASKVKDLSEGRAPLQEPGVAGMLAEGHRAGRLHATVDVNAALERCDMVWICVGTPSKSDGGVHCASVVTAIGQIGAFLRHARQRPLLVVRSTMLPGTMRNKIVPALEESSGLTVGVALSVVFHPEFLREGCAVDDFERPSKIVVGETHSGAADALLSIYQRVEAPCFRLTLEEAELVKYYDNLFHALKVTFANELGTVARSVGADARRVADVFVADTKLNISPCYLRPGFAFGGSCLPKDLRAVLRYGAEKAIRLPMLQGILESNQAQIETFVSRLLAYRPRAVGMVGLAFKPNTDDMRESPYVTVAKRLIGEGVKVRVYDPGVAPARLIGSNKEAVRKNLEHLEALLVSSPDDLGENDVIVINHAIVDAGRVQSWLRDGIRVVDLVGMKGVSAGDPGYEGIYW